MKTKIASEIFRLAREGKSLTQQELAEIANIDRSAIAHYEKQKYSLSLKTLQAIAPSLDINPDYFVTLEYPWKSNNVIKYFITNDFSLFDMLFLYSSYIYIIFLIPPFSLLHKLFSIIDGNVYAVAVKDQNDNIFLFRHKKEYKCLKNERFLKNHVESSIEKYGKEDINVMMSIKEISPEIMEKIEKWTVERKNIEPLFDLNLQPMPVSFKERQYLLNLRGVLVNPEDFQTNYTLPAHKEKKEINGKNILITKIPAKIFLEDTLLYLKYGDDIGFKRKTIEDIIYFYRLRIMKDFSESNYKKDMRKACEMFHIPYSDIDQ